MKTIRWITGNGLVLLVAGVLGCLLTGCAVVGPTAISSGRLTYNEAISETNNQQMLMVAIHNRYEERGSLLAVSSVTANVRVATSTGIQLGFGDSDNYVGNLVPFSAGAVYEENPTISYTPVEGEKYARQLMTPVSLAALAQLTQTLSDPTHVYNAIVSSVNGIQNPDFMYSDEGTDQRFSRFVTLMTRLNQANRLHLVESSQQAGSFLVVIDHYAPAYTADVDELMGLLGLPRPGHRSPRLILPVSLALDGRDSGGIGFTTYSVWDLVEVLSAAIDVPEDDLATGVTATYPPAGLIGRELRIRYARNRPEHAYVSVKYRDVWFYIDEKDRATKRFFRLMTGLWSIAIAESTVRASAAPVLTVPVSR